MAVNTLSAFLSAWRPRRRLMLAATVALTLGGAGSAMIYARSLDLMAQAKASFDRGDIAGAQLLLRTVLRARPDDVEAQWLLGRANLEGEDPVAAERAFRAASAGGINPARLRLPLVKALLAQQKAAEALELLAADGADPAERPALLIAQAKALELEGDQSGAASALDEAAGLAPKLIDIPLAAADLALSHGNLQQAERQAERALLINGRSSRALLLKAQAMEQRGQRSAALDVLGKAVTLDPKMPELRLERARILLGLGRTKDARADVDTLLATKPASVPATYLKAAALIQDGDYAGADLLLQRLSRHIPRLVGGWFTIATVKLHLEQLEQAAEAADKYLAAAPNDLDGRKLRARIALAAQRPGQVGEVLDAFVAAGTADAETFELVGAAHAMAGRLADAERDFSQAAILAPQDPSVLAHLGAARLMTGDAPGAFEALDRSLRLSPMQPEVGQRLVVAAVAAGQPDRAAKALATLRQQTGETAATAQLDAILSVAQFDLQGAASRLAELTARYPADNIAALQWARVLLMQGRDGHAETVLTSVLAKEPAQETALGLLIPLLERVGRAARAAAVLEAARKAAPGDPRPVLLLSALHARAGDAAKALAAFGPGTSSRDAPVAVRLARAAAEAAAGQVAAARQSYEDVIRVRTAPVEATVQFADFLVSQGAFEEAGQRLAAALVEAPGHAEVQRALVRQRFRANGLSAALALADTLRRDPVNLPAAGFLRGDVLLAAGKHVEAASAYEAELATAPSSALAVRTAAATDAAYGPIAALRLLRRWLDAHRDDVPAMAMLATMQLAVKQTAAAIAVLEQLAARLPNDPAVLNNLAWAYHEAGDVRAYPLALRAYLSTFDPNIADTLGCILLSANRSQDALTLLRFAARERPDRPAVQLHLAQAARQAGLRDEARTLLTSLIARPFEGRAAAAQLLADLDAN